MKEKVSDTVNLLYHMWNMPKKREQESRIYVLLLSIIWQKGRFYIIGSFTIVTTIQSCYNLAMGATLEGSSGGPSIGKLNSCSYRNPYGKSFRKGDSL